MECHLLGFSEGLLKPPDFPALLALQHTGEVLGAEARLSRPRHACEAYPLHRRVRLRSKCIVTLGVVGKVIGGVGVPGHIGSEVLTWAIALWFRWQE